jgi:hypothetical protein
VTCQDDRTFRIHFCQDLDRGADKLGGVGRVRRGGLLDSLERAQESTGVVELRRPARYREARAAYRDPSCPTAIVRTERAGEPADDRLAGALDGLRARRKAIQDELLRVAGVVRARSGLA